MADNTGKDIGHFFGIPADVEEPAGLESTWSYSGTPDYRGYSGEMDTASAQYYSDLQRALAARQAQEGLVAQLQDQAAGRGESAAQLMYEQRRQQALQDQASLASSARGMRSATSQRALTEQAAESQRKAILESAMLRLQEQRSAQQALAGVSQQMRGQDYTGAGLAGQMYGTQASALGAQNQNRLGVEELKQKDAAQRAAAQMERYRLAVAQEAARAKAWGDFGKNLLGGGGQAGGFAQNMMKNTGGGGTPTSGVDGGNSYGNDYSTEEDNTGGEAQTDGEFEDFGFDGEPDGGGYSTEEDNVGGEADTSESYAQGGFVQGLSRFAPGGVVKGRARVRGDSARNDTQPALMQPGQVVLPRTVAQSPNAPQKAKSFVQHLRCGGPVRGYADGGDVVIDDEVPTSDEMPSEEPAAEVPGGPGAAPSDPDEGYETDRLWGPGSIHTSAIPTEWNKGYVGLDRRDWNDLELRQQQFNATGRVPGSIEHRNLMAVQQALRAKSNAARWQRMQDTARANALASGEGMDPDAAMARLNAVTQRKQSLAERERQHYLDKRGHAYDGVITRANTGRMERSRYAPEELEDVEWALKRDATTLAGEEEGTRAALEAAKERDAQRNKEIAQTQVQASSDVANAINEANRQKLAKQYSIKAPPPPATYTGPHIATYRQTDAGVKREEPQPMADGGEISPYAQVSTGLGDANVSAPNGLPGMLTQTSSASAPVADDAANASRALALGDANVLAAQSSLKGALGLANGGDVVQEFEKMQAGANPTPTAEDLAFLEEWRGAQSAPPDATTGLSPAEMDTYQRPMSSGQATIANRARMEKEDELEEISRRPQLAPLKPVNAVLSPGEIVVDRGTAQDPERVRQFVAAIKKDDSPPEFAGVLAARSRAEQAAKQAAPADQQPSPEAKEFVERMASPDGQSVYDPRQDEVDAYIAKLQAAQNASQATEAAREMTHSTMDRGEKPRRNFMQALAAKYGYDTSFTAGMPTLHPRERNKQ